jgi:hypothetical protein
VASSHKDDVLEGAQDLLSLLGDSVYELECNVGQLCIGVDKCFEEDQGRVDILSNTLREDIAFF